MRRNYYILWLDDEFDSFDNSSLIELTEFVKRKLNTFGYRAEIYSVSSITKANEFIDKKIDLFISDFNISDKENGFQFLQNVRNKYQQDLILYSGNSSDTIKNTMIDFFKKSNDINIFSRFSFESSSNINVLENKIEQIISLNLKKRNELNALRGLVLSEMSLFERKLKDRLSKNDFDKKTLEYFLENNRKFTTKYSEMKQYIDQSSNNNVIDELSFSNLRYLFVDNSNKRLWKETQNIIHLRNNMAHNEEIIDEKGFAKIADSYRKNFFFMEDNITKYRLELFKFLDDFNAYLDSFKKATNS